MTSAIATNGLNAPLDTRVTALEQAHDFLLEKVSTDGEHLERNTQSLDDLRDDVRTMKGDLRGIAAALGVVQQRGSRADELVEEAARQALGLTKDNASTWRGIVTKLTDPMTIRMIVLAVATAIGGYFARQATAPTPPVHIVAPAAPSAP